MDYESIASDFLSEFGEGSHCIHCDFRPQFDGHLIDFAQEINPQPKRDVILVESWQTFTKIARWISERRDKFSPEDRCQIIIGWPEAMRDTGRQILKGWIDVQRLTSVPDCFDEDKLKILGGDSELVSGWDYEVDE